MYHDVEFEWDLVKESENIRKHGFSFSDAIDCFRDPLGINFSDHSHSMKEKRFYWIGQNLSGKVLTVRYTIRSNKIRIIGCAYWRKFRSIYETTKVK